MLRVKFEADYLASLVWAGAAKRWGDPLPDDIRARLEFELRTKKTTGWLHKDGMSLLYYDDGLS